MATVTVNITGDANSFKQAMASASEKLDQFGAKAQAVGDRATNIGRSMTFGVTLPLIGIGKMAFDELSQSAAASAQTEAAIRSTGGAANVTAAQIDQLSASLLRKSGIDDETIKGGANVLLTFRAIRNEAGAGNDIFNQATKAALDLSVAFGKDMNSSAILVGKALQDPIQGLSALARVGVQFDEGQKQQIQSMVAAGDVMGAQKVILRELRTEVGGSAEAYGNSFAGKVSKAKEELRNASAAIMSTAVPVMQKLADIALGAAQFFARLPGPVKQVAVVFGALAAAAGPLVYIFGSLAKAISGTVSVAKFLISSYQTIALKALYAAEAIKAMTLAQFAAAAAPFALAAGIVVAGVALEKFLGDGSKVFAGFLDSVTKGIQAGKNFAGTLIASATATGTPLAQLRASLESLRAKRAELDAQFDAGKITMSEAAGSAAKYKTAMDEVKGKIAEVKQANAEAKAVEQARKLELQNLANGTLDVANASVETKQAIQDLSSAILAASGTELGLEQANINLTKSQQDYAAALESGDPAKIAEADLNLRQARLGVAQATESAYTANENLNNLARRGWEVVNQTIAQKKDEIKIYGDASGAIQGEIDKLFWLTLHLNGVPPAVGSKVDVNTADAHKNLDDLDTRLAGFKGLRIPIHIDINEGP